MGEIKVDASELKDEGSEAVNELAALLRDKTSAEVTTDGLKLTVKGEGAAVSKKYVKVLLKKFLQKRELKDSFRVIMDEENTLKVKERRMYEEE
jgi:hypothetical protein